MRRFNWPTLLALKKQRSHKPIQISFWKPETRDRVFIRDIKGNAALLMSDFSSQTHVGLLPSRTVRHQSGGMTVTNPTNPTVLLRVPEACSLPPHHRRAGPNTAKCWGADVVITYSFINRWPQSSGPRQSDFPHIYQGCPHTCLRGGQI